MKKLLRNVTGSRAGPIHLLRLQIYFAYHLGWCYEVQYDLLEAQKIGKLCLDTFITERIETNNIDFYAPIKKKCARTFEKEKKQSD